jgi:hypothetical protein
MGMRRRSFGPVAVIAICAALSANANAQDTAVPEPAPARVPVPKNRPPATKAAPDAHSGEASPEGEPAAESEAPTDESSDEAGEHEADWPPPSHPAPMESDEQSPEYPPGYGPYQGPPPGYGVAPPRPPPEPTGPMRRNNTGMMVAGIVLTSLGAIGLATGVALADAADPEDTKANCVSGPCGNDEPLDVRKRNAAIAVAIGGLALVGAGVPLLVVGARQVPANEDGEVARNAAVPQVTIGLTGGRLTWTF